MGRRPPSPGVRALCPLPPPPRRMRPPLPLSQFPQSQTGQTGPARLGNITALPPGVEGGGTITGCPGPYRDPPTHQGGWGDTQATKGGASGGGTRPRRARPSAPSSPVTARPRRAGAANTPRPPPGPLGTEGGPDAGGCPPLREIGEGGGELPGPLGSMVGGVPLPMVNWGGRGTGLLAGWVPWGPWGG